MPKYKRTIDLKVLGTLECSSGGKRLDFAYLTGTKVAQLFLLLVYNAHRGTPKNDVLDVLYRDSEVDAGNSLKTLFARTRKTMSDALGLPGAECLTLKDGFYDVGPAIEVRCDAREFQKLCDDAMAETDETRCIGVLNEACAAYHGELLPMLSTEDWVIFENVTMVNRYAAAIRELGRCCDEQKNHVAALRCYERARVFFPYEEEWIVGVINQLLALGQNKQALATYEEITQTLLDELGVYPSEKLLAVLRRVSRKLSAPISTTETTRAISADKVGGAHYYTYPALVNVGQVFSSIMQRDGISATYLHLTVTAADGAPLTEKGDVAAAISCLHIAVGKSLRATDLFARYSGTQMVVMLWKMPMVDAHIAIERIKSRFVSENAAGRFALQCEVHPGDELPQPPTPKKIGMTTGKHWLPM